MRTRLIVPLLLAAYSTLLPGCSEKPDQPDSPNVLFIVADDLGFSDLGAFGGEINTPNIDALTARGYSFNRFYTAAMCAPSRAMLLTGVDHHQTGLGTMAELLTENQEGNPGYEGYLNHSVVTLPELLRKNGYHTYGVGKWHLGYKYDQSPRARGFERSFMLLNGGASHFADKIGPYTYHPIASYREDGELVDALPDGFYSSRNFTDKLIEHIDSNIENGRPFFAYAAYTAPHWPIQAPDDVRDAYAGVYDQGYEAIRAKRYAAAQELGLFADQVGLAPLPSSVSAWQSLSAEDQRYAAREMEVYAAMIEEMDRNIGRLIAYLEQKGRLENTLIVFLSDNGADAFSLDHGPAAVRQQAGTQDNSFENIGKPGSFNFMGPKWAHASEAPFRLYKTMSTEGGIRVPAIIVPPQALHDDARSGSLIGATISSMDLVPTVMDLTGIDHPERFEGTARMRPQGRSIVPILVGRSTAIRGDNDVLGFELLNRRAIIKGDWKALFLPTPIGSGEWQLYDLASDPGEQNDLAREMPAKLEELIAEWDAYAERNGVVLPPPGPMTVRPSSPPTR